MGHDKAPPPPPATKPEMPKPATPDSSTKPKVEGEGSYEATHHYNDGLKSSIERGDGEELAKKAASALDGPEAKELADAEKKGKAGNAS